MKTTRYDISVDAADLLEEVDAADLIEEVEAADLIEEVDAAELNLDRESANVLDAFDARDSDNANDSDSANDSDNDNDNDNYNDSDNDTADHKDSNNPSATHARRPPREPPLPDLPVLDENDLPWVARLVDIIVACEGQPWRVALESIDGAQHLERPGTHHHFAAVVGALQRVLGGRGHKAQLARACRELVLGHPALSSSTRADRVAAAARALSLSVADVERLLWSDLPRERPVELPFGRPSELEVTAFANVQLIQRAVRRAQTMSIAVRGDAGPLIRGASTRGLLANVGVDASDRDVVVIDIVGPLTLCHRTAVYGRAIASLVPFLAECGAFELVLTASGASGPYRSRLSSPVLMPRLSAAATTSSAVTTRLARDLRRTLHDVEIVVGPSPVLVGDTFVCPDIAIDRGRLCIEIIGFWTASYLERKRAAYARAGLDVLFLVDAERGCVDDGERHDGGRRDEGRGRAHDALPGNVVPFKRHVDVAALAGWIPMTRDYADAAHTRRTRRR